MTEVGTREEVQEEDHSVIGIDQDHKCTRQFVVSVVKNAKSLLSQLAGSLFIVVNALQSKKRVHLIVPKEEVTEDLDFRIKKCLTQRVINVEKDLNFPLNQLVVGQFIVVNALKEITVL